MEFAPGSLTVDDLSPGQPGNPDGLLEAVRDRDRAWRTGDVSEVVRSCLSGGRQAEAAGNLAVAWRLAREAEATARSLGRSIELADAYSLLGWLAFREEMFEDARDLFGYSLKVRSLLGDVSGSAVDFQNLGNTLSRLGDIQEGESLLRTAIDGHVSAEGKAGALRDLAVLLASLSRTEEAAGLLESGLMLVEPDGSPLMFGVVACSRGDVAVAEGDMDRAESMYAGAARAFRLAGRTEKLGEAYERLAFVAVCEGRSEQAVGCAQESVRLFHLARCPEGEARGWLTIADMRLGAGGLGEAEKCFTEASSCSRKAGWEHGVAEAMRGLGECAAKRGLVSEAFSAWLGAAALFREIGLSDRARDLEAWCTRR